jgi:uncharacterized protein YoaH (UPF0181 family)
MSAADAEAPRPALALWLKVVRTTCPHTEEWACDDCIADVLAAALTATHEAAERERVEAIQKLNAERVECGVALTKLAAAERERDEARHGLRQYQNAFDVAVKAKHAAQAERDDYSRTAIDALAEVAALRAALERVLLDVSQDDNPLIVCDRLRAALQPKGDADAV